MGSRLWSLGFILGSTLSIGNARRGESNKYLQKNNSIGLNVHLHRHTMLFPFLLIPLDLLLVCFVEKSSIKFPENSLLKTQKCKFLTDTIFSSRYESSFGGDLICQSVWTHKKLKLSRKYFYAFYPKKKQFLLNSLFRWQKLAKDWN